MPPEPQISEDQELDEILYLADQIERERVSPRFDEWRKHYSYKIAWGGRGAGAKTESAFSLAVQFGETPDYFGESVNIIVTREVQNTIDLSSYEAVAKKVKALRYKGWEILKDTIRNRKNGSKFSFRGLSDLTADNFRSLQDVDILIVEEAHGIGYRAWETVLPSMRKKGCEVWVLFNRVEEMDPCYDLFVANERPNSCLLELKPGNIDNPWFDDSELPEKRDADYKRDPEEAAHIWEGLPRKKGSKAVMGRPGVVEATKRVVERGHPKELGVDVARFGDDKSTFYLREGMVVTDWKVVAKADTQETARIAWDMVGRDPNVPIKVDVSGIGAGTCDKLRELGANVIEVNFGGKPSEPDKYTSVADEMWFNFPISEARIPDDIELIQELSTRQYAYTTKDQRKIEPKEVFKKRLGRSPDRADGLILAFFQPNVVKFSWAL